MSIAEDRTAANWTAAGAIPGRVGEGSGLLIGNTWREPSTGAWLDVTDPATDAPIARVARGGAADARSAIDAAAAALPAWKALPGIERGAYLRRLADLMLRHEERLGSLMTTEQGKPIGEARGEIRYAAGFLSWSAEEATRIYGETVPAFVPDKRILVLRQAAGVAAAITPWNFPAAMITRKLGPALAAGCTMVVKPASQTPLSALAIGELALEAGFPSGIFNIVTGSAAEIADMFLADPRVRVVSFTGSNEVGKRLFDGAAANLTRLSLELGGNAPFIVFDDADPDRAVTGAVASKFRNGGQTCICANRFYVQAGIYDAFIERFNAAVGALQVGSGFEPGVTVGPLIDDRAIEKVEGHLSDAVTRGARIRVGGHRVEPGAGFVDRFFEPTVIEQVSQDMLITREETFGPVAPVTRFRSEAEVIEAANATPNGLAAYFYTRDASRLIRVAEALEFGIVGANDALPSTPQAPFGGWKESGLGREGGKWGLEEYLDTKYISWGL
jgi:succinate-semialdehyde dehydrogenase/glutarate-semialdehyde dehydrogenase